MKFGDDGLHFDARGEFGLFQVLLGDLAVRKETDAEADAAHVQAFELERGEPVADDEFGGSAADVHHQPVVIRLRHAVCDAKIDQARFLMSGNDFDRKSQDAFCLRDEVGGVLCHAQRVGTDHAHRLARQAAQPFGKPAQCGKGALLRAGIEEFIRGESGGQPDLFTQPVQHVELVALHARDLQTKIVGTEVYCGKDRLLTH